MTNMLTHKCNIYHLQDTTKTLGYGLPANAQKEYPATPNLTNVSCYFTQQANNMSQMKPAPELNDTVIVVFSKDTDIRRNDKIVNTQNGRTYRASQPELIKNHHYEVNAVMEEIV